MHTSLESCVRIGQATATEGL